MTTFSDYILNDPERGSTKFVPSSAKKKLTSPKAEYALSYEVNEAMTRTDLVRAAAYAAAHYAKIGDNVQAGTAFAFACQMLGLDGKEELRKARAAAGISG